LEGKSICESIQGGVSATLVVILAHHSDPLPTLNNIH
jgi:hypothetical protein